ncbi:MAG TPA: aromatic ring-hydroxylating dioxygenase subunit alpha [Rubrobacteraceae bacterium]|nr:aromatic ring-hydroxylating dioxygenase subunit alpha [Rubrobacteraceae bacterium]
MHKEFKGQMHPILEEMDQSLPEGEIPAGILSDPEIFELERERVFARSWVYIAHESEIPNPGDYVLRYIVDNRFIVVRDEEGQVRALLDICRHRGMQVCRAEMGNASHFRCPYHGWTYRNDGSLIGVPSQKAAYGDRLDKSQIGLEQIRVEAYSGMIFGTMDPEAPPLEEWLGDIRWYLELITRRSPEGLEVIGAPQRWVVDVNWKLASENFVGDSYHTLMTHRSMVELGVAPRDARYAMYGEQIHIPDKGHGSMVIGAPPGAKLPPFWGYPEEMLERARTSYPTKEQFEVARETRIMLVTVFPNLSIHNPIRSPHHKYQGSVPMLTFRVWNPIGPGKIEIFSWFLVEKDAPEEFKQLSSWSYLRSFGISGTFEQDDAEIWTRITNGASSSLGRQHKLNYQMGTHHEPDPDWPGPGVAYPVNFTDVNLRNFYSRWLEMMRS